MAAEGEGAIEVRDLRTRCAAIGHLTMVGTHRTGGALLAAALVAIAALACGTPGADAGATDAAAQRPAAVAPRDHHVTATYFHTRARCATCRNLEAYARQALEEAFSEQLADGRLVWRTVNFHEPTHRHYMRDYGLTYQSLVLVETQGGDTLRWKNLDRIWKLVGDRRAYGAYVRGETAAYLEAVP